MNNKIILTIELVPQSSWYSNVRSEVSKDEWDIIRRKCYKQANYKCEICGGKGDKWPVECHEIWEYKDSKSIQLLKGFIALCPNCHMVKHIGLAQISGNLNIAVNHLCKINEIKEYQAFHIIDKAFKIWKKRNQKKWNVDISFIENYLSQQSAERSE